MRLAADPGLWARADATKPNRFGVFEGGTEHIVFQFPLDLRSHLESEYSPLWEPWSSLVSPVIDQVGKSYDYPRGRTGRVMLAKLRAGREIRKHVDRSPSAAVPHKIHVPILTSPDVEFWEENEVYHLERGWAYEVNNRVLHGGRNPTGHDRVHLIFDYYDPGGARPPAGRRRRHDAP